MNGRKQRSKSSCSSNPLWRIIRKEFSNLQQRSEEIVIRFTLAVAEQILRREVILDDTVVLQQIKEGLRRVLGVDHIKVRVNPVDEAMVREHRASIASGSDSLRDMLIEADEKVERGGCILESDSGNVDVRISTQMKKIEAALLEKTSMMKNSNMPDVLDDLMNQETRTPGDSGPGGREGRSTDLFNNFDGYLAKLRNLDLIKVNGRVTQVIGLVIESIGPNSSLGEVCVVKSKGGEDVCLSEVVGFRNNRVLSMVLGEANRVSPGSEIVATGKTLSVSVGDVLLGTSHRRPRAADRRQRTSPDYRNSVDL